MRRSRPFLAATLIVRDEAHQLGQCLASLDGVVDEIVVYDTGSRDGTPELARRAGARVQLGHWDDDFARARNAALAMTGAEWALHIDADERVVADPGGAPATRPPPLRNLLSATDADVLTVLVRNVNPEELGGSYRHPAPRLLRRERVSFVGRVHEQPVSGRGRAGAACLPDVFALDHLGYADADLARAKAARNADIALAELGRLSALPSAAPAELAKTLLDAGRSLVGCGAQQEAVHAFEAVRELVPGSRRALEATDALARLLLAAGMDEVVLLLVEELRAGGVDGRYCDWLRAQALAQLGGVDEALELLSAVDLLRDAAGRELDLGQVAETRSLVAGLAGLGEEAAGHLAVAMLGHGRIIGRGPLLLDLWGDLPASGLVAMLRATELAPALAVRIGARPELIVELAGCRSPGPAVAAAFGAAGLDAAVLTTAALDAAAGVG